MKSQKASRLDLAEKKVKALTNVIQGIMNDMAQMKDLSIGTLETIKLMPDYDEALDELKKNLEVELELTQKT
jgi:biotin synthase-related radical SAM superfamily protein